MRCTNRTVLFALLLLSLAGCQREPSAAAGATKQAPRVLGPAVAGSFYPLDAKTLAADVDRYLAEARPAPVERLRALVCPHAGYQYSGPIAAYGYKLLAGREFRTVIVLGPSHTAWFDGAAVADADVVETPLGNIPISPKAATLGHLAPFTLNPKCQVKRPPWWQSAPKQLPAFGEETPHTWEHSVEVQWPFLQRVLKRFEAVPVVMGDVDPEAAAQSLLKVLDDDTLLIASSDLTHYLPYETAKSLDTTTVRAICSLSVEWLEEEEAAAESQARIQLACGRIPILTVMHVARQKGWKARLLDYRNSGDTTGKKDAVVGYSAIAFYEPPAQAKSPAKTESGGKEFAAAARRFLLELARKSVTAAAKGERPPALADKSLGERFTQPRACFVTLKKNHELRGCVGTVFPRLPLGEAVVFAGRSAAIADHRFEPVRPEELDQIEIEVSILTLPERLKFDSPDDLLAKLRPGVDGVVLRVGSHQGLFLPQVWEQLPDKRKFLDRLAEEKAGLAPDAWQSKDARILVYQVEAFVEPKR